MQHIQSRDVLVRSKLEIRKKVEDNDLPNTQTVPQASAPTVDKERALLSLVQAFALELHPDKHGLRLTLDSSLEKDAGIDSLARVELLLRIERAFGATLSEQLAMAAETPRDLLRGLTRLAPPQIAEALHPEPAPVPQAAAAEAVPVSAATLVEALDWHARLHPERVHINLYAEGDLLETLTYGELLDGAQRIAAALRARDVVPGQCVSIMLPTSRDFFHSFFGILLAGATPVPIYPPMRMTQIEEHLRRQIGILGNAQAVLLITVPEAQPLGRLVRPQLPELRDVVTAEELLRGNERAHLNPAADDIALLQYTSGSTGNPKGVVLTHTNLLANVRAMGEATQATSSDVFVSWLPLYHDMGLIGAWLGSLYHACPFVVMSPLAFIARPQRWLWAIHRHRGALSAAPNFAYELCASRIDDKELEGLNLSSWRVAFNGAEPVSPDTLERFIARFERYGFRREAMTPVYGLAECSVGLAFPPLNRGPHIDYVQREAFQRHGHAEPAFPDDPHALRFVACGRPLSRHEIRIVDEADRELGERQVGRLQFSGPSATSGYFRNPEATAQLVRKDGWLDSGDYAYMVEGEAYITGRAKDLIIRGGRNIYPYELEEAIGNLPGIRKGNVAVFGSVDPQNGIERLVVLAETRVRSEEKKQALREEVRALTLNLTQVAPDDVVLALPRTVLRTSSGKIRRAACRELYERGDLLKHRAVWLQFLRLAAAGVIPQLRRLWRRAGALIYAGYAWAVFGLLAAPLWLAVAVLPHLHWRRSTARLVARLVLRLTGTPLAVSGLDNLPRDQTCVLVANHASYLDAVALTAALPARFGFVAKRELAGRLVSKVLLGRLGTEFVERFDVQRGVEDFDRMAETVQKGRSLLVFPEGTFSRAPGLRRFRMGAFVAAVRGEAPVVPITIRGTRSMLRGDEWFPRPGRVSVIISPPLRPQGADWNEAVLLRDATRAEILRHCGEPDLIRET